MKITRKLYHINGLDPIKLMLIGDVRLVAPGVQNVYLKVHSCCIEMG